MALAFQVRKRQGLVVLAMLFKPRANPVRSSLPPLDASLDDTQEFMHLGFRNLLAQETEPCARQEFGEHEVPANPRFHRVANEHSHRARALPTDRS